MHTAKQVRLKPLLFSVASLLTAASLALAAQQADDERNQRRDARVQVTRQEQERRVERRVRNEDQSDRRRRVREEHDRPTDGPRQREEEKRLRFEFVISDDSDGHEVVEQVVRELRSRFGRPGDPPQRATRGPRDAAPRRQEERSDRQRHLASAIEHLEAAGLPEIARLVRHRAARPESQRPSQPPRSNRRQEDSDTNVPTSGRQLTRMTEELRGAFRELQGHVRRLEHNRPALDEVHRQLEEVHQQMDQRARQLERATSEVADALKQHVAHMEVEVAERFQHVEDEVAERFQHVEDEVAERFQHMEVEVAERMEELEQFLEELHERFEDDDDDEHEEDNDD